MEIRREGKQLTIFPGDFNEEKVYCFHAREAAMIEHAEQMYSSLSILIDEAKQAGIACEGYEALIRTIDNAS